jgi:hypothetical protein
MEGLAMLIPRVTGGIRLDGTIEEGILWTNGLITSSDWFLPKHQRRGRLVHAACHLIAQGQEIDEAWYGRGSGEGEDDRVEHGETLPYIQGCRNALAENDITDIECELEVRHRALKYVGHLDWKCICQSEYAIIDLKCGAAPPPNVPHWHHIQTALYGLALSDILWVQTGKMIIFKRWALYLGPANGRSLYKLVAHDNPHDYRAAENFALTFHNRRTYTNGSSTSH